MSTHSTGGQAWKSILIILFIGLVYAPRLAHAVIASGAAVLAAGIYMYFSKDDHEDMSEKQESIRKDH